eukprot:symbB.v1.2.041321.t2/scaffold8053.1/size7985/2
MGEIEVPPHLGVTANELMTSQVLFLKSRQITDLDSAIAPCLKQNASLRQLFIGYNEFGDEGARHLCEALAAVEGGVLELVGFRHCKLGDGAAQAVADFIKSSKTIAEVGVDENNISDSGPAFFIVTEVFFGVFFTFELFIRFLAFKQKRQCLVDFWFIFDFLLVVMMDVETFVLPLMVSSGSPLAMLSTLRLLRLLRVSRMAKLMRTFPELMLIVKGLAAAVRAVSWTLVLLVMILCVWSIIFTSIYHQGFAKDEDVAERIESLFGNLSKSAFSLIIMGTLLDEVTYCCNMIRESQSLEDAMAAILNDLGVGNGISRQKFMLDSELGNEHCDIVCVAIGFVMFEIHQ